MVWLIPPLNITLHKIKFKINYNTKSILLAFVSLSVFAANSSAQDSNKFYFTMAVGIFAPVLAFSRAYEISLALNSGIEYQFSRHYFTQFVLDFNAVKYNQQVKDGNYSYLFQPASSSIR